MAGEGDGVKEALARQLARFDDEALALLANKGIVRRAAKDFETVKPSVIEESAERLQLLVGDSTVTFPDDRPGSARCSCPAREKCRHIVLCCLWLRQEGTAPLATPAQEKPLPAWNDLVRWSGRRVAHAGFELADEVELTADATWTIARLPSSGITVRFLPDEGIDSMLCSCKSGDVCAHRVAAAVAWVRAKGGTIDRGDDVLTPAVRASQPPRTREEVLHAAKEIFESMLTIGISQLSDASRQRTATLAISANGVDLPRLALRLRAISDDVDLLLRRDAHSDASRLLLSLARAYALADAIEHGGPVALAGEHRAEYSDIGTLELAGLGAYAWRTASGYAGLTAVFWSIAANDFYTWSEARPMTQAFDPRVRLFSDPPWEGIATPHEASRSRLRLTHARSNAQRRLSSSSKTKALRLGSSDPRAIAFGVRQFAEWSAVRAYAATTLPLGLESARSTSAFVVLKPAAWGRALYDPLRQQLRRAVMDASGEEVPLIAQFREDDESAVRLLESLDPKKKKVWGVLARLTVGEELQLWPVSLFAETGIIAVNVPEERSAKQATATTASAEEIEDEDEAASASPVATLIARLDTVAERGLALAPRARTSLEAEASRLRKSGLRLLARETAALAAAPSATGVLRTRYLAELLRESASRLL